MTNKYYTRGIITSSLIVISSLSCVGLSSCSTNRSENDHQKQFLAIDAKSQEEQQRVIAESDSAIKDEMTRRAQVEAALAEIEKRRLEEETHLRQEEEEQDRESAYRNSITENSQSRQKRMPNIRFGIGGEQSFLSALSGVMVRDGNNNAEGLLEVLPHGIRLNGVMIATAVPKVLKYDSVSGIINCGGVLLAADFERETLVLDNGKERVQFILEY